MSTEGDIIVVLQGVESIIDLAQSTGFAGAGSKTLSSAPLFDRYPKVRGLGVNSASGTGLYIEVQ